MFAFIFGIIAQDILLRKLGGDLAKRFVKLFFVDRRIDLSAGLVGDLDHPAFGGELPNVGVAAARACAFVILEIGGFDDIDLAI